MKEKLQQIIDYAEAIMDSINSGIDELELELWIEDAIDTCEVELKDVLDSINDSSTRDNGIDLEAEENY